MTNSTITQISLADFNDWYWREYSYGFNVIRKKSPYLRPDEVHDIYFDLHSRLLRKGHRDMGEPNRRNLICHLTRERDSHLRHKLTDYRGGKLEHICAHEVEDWMLKDERSRYVEQLQAREELAILLSHVKVKLTRRESVVIAMLEKYGVFEGKLILGQLDDDERALFVTKKFKGNLYSKQAHKQISQAINRTIYGLRNQFKEIRAQYLDN